MNQRGEKYARDMERLRARAAAKKRAREHRWSAQGRARVIHFVHGTVVVPHCSNLAAIVEHAGMIPGENEPTHIMKDLDPQLVIPATADEEMNAWRVGERGGDVSLVPVIMQGFQIFQTVEGAGACWGVPLYHLGMIERAVAERQGAVVVDDDRLLWDGDGEAVVVEAVRKAKSGWARAWERAVWEALEGVDLHKEEDT